MGVAATALQGALVWSRPPPMSIGVGAAIPVFFMADHLLKFNDIFFFFFKENKK